MPVFSRLLAILAVFALLGCAPADKDLAEPFEPLGAFKLGFTVVVADDAQKISPSRAASEEDLETALKTALDRRFSRFSGTQFYHIAVSVDGYALAIPGIPLLLSPKSILVLGVTVWDDAAGGKIDSKPKQFTVLERLSGETFVGSGLTQSKEQQLANLSNNAARLIEAWMRENPDWFAQK
jgi:hypothetical protein